MTSSPTTPTASDQTAVAIYVVMSRDPMDALEMIAACEDREALNLLLGMLTTTGNPNTDHGLNSLFVQPVQRRLDRLGSPVDPVKPPGTD